MSSLTISPAPPPAAANTDAASAQPDTGKGFGDALRQTQARPEPRDSGHPRGTSGDGANHDDGTVPPGGDDGNGDNDASREPGVVAALVPPATLIPTPRRQATAASGKPVPAAIPAATLARTSGAAEDPGTRPRGGAPEALQPTSAPETIMASDAQLQGRDGDPKAAASGRDVPGPPQPPLDQFSAHLSQLAGVHSGAQAASAPPPTPPPVQLPMQASPGQPQFAQETAQHVSWLAGQGIQQARIQLNPRELGPIHVEVTTHHDRVDVSFAAQHPQTVHALQQTLPQLHDMLAQHGLNLGQASVGQQAPGQQQHAFAQHTGFSGRDSADAEAELRPAMRPLRTALPGRVDDFA